MFSLTHVGKLQMVNAVLSSLPTYFMCIVKLPSETLEQVDIYRKHCLWRGVDLNSKKPSLVAWDMVTRPKEQGGLGVLKLRTQNEALMLKNLHKFFNRADLPWVRLIWDSYYQNGKSPGQQKRGSFWWKDIVKLINQYKGIAMPIVNDGKTVSLWDHL